MNEVRAIIINALTGPILLLHDKHHHNTKGTKEKKNNTTVTHLLKTPTVNEIAYFNNLRHN